MKTVKVTDVDPKVSDEVYRSFSDSDSINVNALQIYKLFTKESDSKKLNLRGKSGLFYVSGRVQLWLELDWGLFIVNNFETIIICGSAAEVRINPKSLYFNDKQIGWKVDWKKLRTLKPELKTDGVWTWFYKT